MLAGGDFALKGGTAINLFLRHLPRLSVDFDLVFANHRHRREEALDAITRHLAAAWVSLEKLGTFCDHSGNAAGEELKPFVIRGRTRIKVEVSCLRMHHKLPRHLVELVSSGNQGAPPSQRWPQKRRTLERRGASASLWQLRQWI